jgi:hypothetical protein
MGKEGTPLQHDMFSGDLVDNRSNYRKRLDKAHDQPQQKTMFSLKETVQFGVNARPWLKNLPAPKLELESVDPRTEEEKERDLLHKAQSLTRTMFSGVETPDEIAPVETQDPPNIRQKIPPVITVVGYRARARRAKARVRIRNRVIYQHVIAQP